MQTPELDSLTVHDSGPRSGMASSPPSDGATTKVTSSSLQYAFFLLGIGSLLPFNALLSVLDFYTTKFPTVAVAHYVSNAYSFPFMASGAVITAYPPPRRFRTPLVLFSYLAMTLISALYPLFSRVQSIAIPVVLTALLGAINAMDQSILFGILALLLASHPSCTTAYTAGGAVASLLLVLLRIFTRIVLDIDPGKGALPSTNIPPDSLRPGFILFFIVCTLLCAGCTAVVVWMYTHSSIYATHVLSTETEEPENDHSVSTSTASLLLLSQRTCAADDNQSSTSTPLLPFNMGSVFARIRPFVLSMFFCFVVTLMLFPGITTELPVTLRMNATPAATSWYPLVIVSVFAVGDLLGRISWSGAYARAFPDSIPVASALRALFIPLVAFQWTASKGTSLLAASLTVLTIGVTNGFVMNAGFLVAPKQLDTSSEKEAAGRLMFLANNWGLFAGSSFGVFLQFLLSRHSMFR